MNAFKGDKFLNSFFTFTNMAVLIASLCFAIFFKVLQLNNLFYNSLIPITLFSVSLIFGRLNLKVAQMLFLLSVNISLVYFSLLIGKESSIYLLFIVIAILPLIYFEKDNNLKISAIIFSIGSYFVLEYLLTSNQFPLFIIPQKNIDIISIFSVSLIILLNLFVMITLLYLKRQFEKKLTNSNEELRKSNRELLETNKALKESKELQIQLKQHSDYAQLLQRIAHEFKNPLQMLQGTAEVGLKFEQSKDLFKIVLQSVDRLNHVIHPMLNYLNTEETYNFKPFNIIKIISDIVILSKANCNSKQIKIEVLDKLNQGVVYGDSKAIGQVFINLITNAIDAIGNSGGKITIECINEVFIYQGETKQGVKINIIDNGCGMEEEKIKQIFVPFESSKNTKVNVGLGLSIVSKIIQDHRGLIKINSKPNEGTIISIFLQTTTESPKVNQKDKLFNLESDFFED